MAEDRQDDPPGSGDWHPRSGRRRTVIQQGRIVIGSDRLVACMVRDLSRAGAKLKVAPGIDLPETFDLVIASHDLTTRRAHLRWQRGDLAGVTFADAPG